MKVRIKKLKEGVLTPSYAKNGDAALDLTATSFNLDDKGNAVYGTSLAFEIPEGFVGLLFPRSSICNKNQILSCSVGVLDSGYRGEITFKFKPSEVYLNNLKTPNLYRNKDNKSDILGETMYAVGDRIGQILIIPYPKIEFKEVEELSDSERGSGSYGSSGN